MRFGAYQIRVEPPGDKPNRAPDSSIDPDCRPGPAKEQVGLLNLNRLGAQRSGIFADLLSVFISEECLDILAPIRYPVGLVVHQNPSILPLEKKVNFAFFDNRRLQ